MAMTVASGDPEAKIEDLDVSEHRVTAYPELSLLHRGGMGVGRWGACRR
jgi:hypothetical protein